MARIAPGEATSSNARGGKLPLGDAEVVPGNPAFDDLLRQLDTLLMIQEGVALEAPESPSSIPAQPGPREPLPVPPCEHQEAAPGPSVIPQPRMPSRQEQGRHALERNRPPDTRFTRPVMQRSSNQAAERYRPRHAAQPAPTPRHSAVVLPWPESATPALSREARVRSGRWRAAMACASAVAMAGASMVAVGYNGHAFLQRALRAEASLDPAEASEPKAPVHIVQPGYQVQGEPVGDTQIKAPAEPHTPRVGRTPTKALQAYTEALRTIPKRELQGVCASMLLAQAVVVSSEGTSAAARRFNNPFGIRNSKGSLVQYSSLDKGIAAQARRIKASPYYRDARFFPGQTPDSCDAHSRTVLLGADAKTVRMNLIYAYFTRHKFAAHRTAGMLGNAERESGINPATIQKLGGSARGLWQWEKSRYVSRPTKRNPRLGLKNFTAQRGLPWNDLYGQLEFARYELTTFERKARRALEAARTVNGATDAFAYKFERPNPAPKKIRMDIRRAAAQRALAHHTAQQRVVGQAQQLIVSYDLVHV